MSTFIYVLIGLGLLSFGIYLLTDVIFKKKAKKLEKPVEDKKEEYTPVTMAGDFDGDTIEVKPVIDISKGKDTTVIHAKTDKVQEKKLKEELKKDKSTANFSPIIRFDNTKKKDNKVIAPKTSSKKNNRDNNEAIIEIGTEIPAIIQMHYGVETNHHSESKVIIEDVETKRPITVESDAPVWSRSDISNKSSNNDSSIKTESGAPKWEANDNSYKQPSYTPSSRSSHHSNNDDYSPKSSGSSHRSSYNHDNDYTPSSSGRSGGYDGGGSGGSISDAISSFFD